MAARSSVLVVALLVLASASFAQIIGPPISVTVDTDCQGDDFFLSVLIYNTDPEIELYTVTVRRVTTAPDMLPEALLTPEPVWLTPGDYTHLVLPDPGVGPGDIGYYEIEIRYFDGLLYDSFYTWRSCTEDPFLMRGYLVESTMFVPCTGQEMLECGIVSLFYGDMNQYVGTNELLEIYGWVITLNGRDQCSVSVTRIEPLGAGVGCDDIVPAASMSWGTLKARYR